MRAERRSRANERGATIAFVAVSMAGLLSMAALAIDVGMLFKQRSDAQRATDAAALAGASAFQNKKATDPGVVDTAWHRAINYVGRNVVGTAPINISDTTVFQENGNTYADFPEGQVQVIPAQEKVRVIVYRENVGTFFGRVLGRSVANISAKAAAIAAPAGTAKCVKPFAVPDIWDDADDDTDTNNELEDLGKGQGQGGERWRYKSNPNDYYRRWGDTESGESRPHTGYGSSYRNNSVYKDDQRKFPDRRFKDDYGRPIVLKKSNPQQTTAPSFFMPWVLPGSAPGANDYRKNIAKCNPASINLNQEYTIDASADTSSYDNKPGNMIGPTKQGMDDLIGQDPQACWAEYKDNATGYYTGEVRKLSSTGGCTEAYPGWESSPRVVIVPLFDPALAGNGKTKLKFNNLALLFVENQKDRHEPVVGRFMYFVKGTGAPTNGTLIKQLRLVE